MQQDKFVVQIVDDVLKASKYYDEWEYSIREYSGMIDIAINQPKYGCIISVIVEPSGDEVFIRLLPSDDVPKTYRDKYEDYFDWDDEIGGITRDTGYKGFEGDGGVYGTSEYCAEVTEDTYSNDRLKIISFIEQFAESTAFHLKHYVDYAK